VPTIEVDHTRMEQDNDELFSGLGRVKNFTYDSYVDEEAIVSELSHTLIIFVTFKKFRTHYMTGYFELQFN
jgi:hypothetical protein